MKLFSFFCIPAKHNFCECKFTLTINSVLFILAIRDPHKCMYLIANTERTYKTPFSLCLWQFFQNTI